MSAFSISQIKEETLGSASLNNLFHQTKENIDVTGDSDEKLICLFFRYGKKNYCSSVDAVKEIIDFPVYIPTPVDIGSTLGVFNLRGNIIPILDPDAYFMEIQDKLKFKAPEKFTSMKLRLIIFDIADGGAVALPVMNVGKFEILKEDYSGEDHLTINGLPHEKFDVQKFLVRSL